MKILQRHAFTTLLPALFFSIAALLFLWLIYDLFDTLPDFLKQKPSVMMLVKFYAVQLPKVSLLVVPVAILFTSFYVSNMWSKNREIVILQASGISPFVMYWPFLLVAASCGAGLIFFNLRWAPRAEIDRRLIREQMLGKQTNTLIYDGVVYRNPTNGNVWYLKKIDALNGTFEQAEILIFDEYRTEKLKIFAASGEFINGSWKLNDVKKLDFTSSGSSREGVISRQNELLRWQSDAINDPPQQIVSLLRQPDEMTWRELKQTIDSPHSSSNQRLSQYVTEAHHRFASPFSCIIFCLLGLALGFHPERKEMASSLFICLTVLFGFQVWMNFSLALGNGNRVSPLFAAWNTVFFFGLAALYVFSEKMGWLRNMGMKMSR